MATDDGMHADMVIGFPPETHANVISWTQQAHPERQIKVRGRKGETRPQ
jgi:hypothetical protein